MEIRGFTIKYTSTKKRERNNNEILLLHELERLEAAVHSNPDNIDSQTKLADTNKEIDKLNKYESEGATIRCRAKFQVDGEKPSKFFCNLEKSNAAQKFIPSLLVDVIDQHGRVVMDRHGNPVQKEVTQQKEVEAEVRTFYRKLYSCQDNKITIDTIEEFLGPHANSCPKLNPSERESMEGQLTLSEMASYLKKTRNNTSPGISGYMGEFFKFFWRDLKQFIVGSANYSFQIGWL